MKPRFATIALRRNAVTLAGTITVLFSISSANAADRTKANNTDNLNLATSWNTLPAINDVAVWNNTVTGANTSALGANTTWQGIKITNPGGSVTISAGNTLTLGGLGIDMNAATQNLTISSGLAMRGSLGQIWNVTSTKSLTIDGAAFTRNPYSTLNVQGAGSVSTSSIPNDATEIVGPWATFGTGTAASYATISAGDFAAYTGGTAAATAVDVSSTTGLVNYNLAAVGAFGTGTSFHTLRYTGAAGAITGDFSANGILNSGTGALTLSGNATIGGSRELVVFNGDSNTLRNVTLSGIISDNGSGPSSLVKGGEGILTLSGANTYTGATTITRGIIELNHNSGLGSPTVGTRLTTGGNTSDGSGGLLRVLNGIDTAEPLFMDSTTNSVLFGATGNVTVSGPVRLNTGVRISGGTNTTFTGGISTTGGLGGTFMLFNTNATVTGKPIINALSAALYMDQTQTRIIGVTGNIWGTTTFGAGTLRTDVANALPFGTSLQINGNATLNLNGNSQSINEFKSAGYSVISQDRTLTSTAAATLTLNNTSNVTYDGKITGAVSLVKNATGVFKLSGPNTTTGTLTANGGSLEMNFGRAIASTSGAGTVSDYLPATTPLVLGGGTFQLTGRQDGLATPVTGTWNSGASEITGMSTTAGLAPGQLVSGSGIPAGAYIVSITTTLVGTGNRMVISANTTAAGSGATITPTANSFSSSQALAGLTLNPGSSRINVSANGAVTPATVLNLGTITRNPGGVVNFILPAEPQNATNGVLINNTNTNGILGGWARTGDNWATNSTDLAGGNVIAYSSYTDLTRLDSGTKTITSNASSNARIIEGTGATAVNITPSAPGTTDLNTLLASGTTAATIYNPDTTDILRLGAAGGIMVASNAAALKIGNSVNDGILTGGGADDTDGTVHLVSNNTDSAKLLTINSTITDNGSGVVGVTTSGVGVITLAGANSYSGKTVIGGSGNSNSTDRVQISSDANLGLTPSEFVADHLILAGGTLRSTSALTLDAARGITVTAAGGSLDSLSTMTIDGVISGSGPIYKPGQAGSGAVVLNAENTFSGIFQNGSTGSGSQLRLGNFNALKNATLDTHSSQNQSVVFDAGVGTYNLGALQGTDELALGDSSISIGSNNATTVYGGNYTGTITTASPTGGGITGNGGVTKVGTGSFQFSGANAYMGDTVVSGGMLVLAHINSLQNSTLDTGTSGSQSVNFILPEGTTYNIGGLKGADELDMAVSNLSVGANHQDTTYSGNLFGAFGNSLTKVGVGTLTLSGANTYTGTTTVNSGTLAITGAKAYPGDIGVTGGATLSLANGASLPFSVSGSSSNRITGAGTASLAGSFIISTGGVTATTGTWNLVDATTLSESFEPTFSVAGFTPNVDGVTWTKTNGTQLWSFSETTGTLTLAVGAGTSYSSWIGGFDFSAFPGADLTPSGDADNDGIANALELVIGNLPNQTKVENMPTIGLVTNPAGVPAGDYMKFAYRRTTTSVDASVTSSAQYDTDLVGTWTTAVDGVSGVEIIETANGAIPGTDVEVFIPRSLSVNGKLFGRLHAVVPAP